jgi:hypothetical protein
LRCNVLKHGSRNCGNVTSLLLQAEQLKWWPHHANEFTIQSVN